MPLFRKQLRPTPSQSLAARPVRLASAEVTRTGDGGARLKVPLRQARWTGWFFRLPPGATRTFELDPMGLCVWDHCDGKTAVRQIIRKVARHYRLSDREAEVSTRRFLHTLVKKGLIGLRASDR